MNVLKKEKTGLNLSFLYNIIYNSHFLLIKKFIVYIHVIFKPSFNQLRCI